MLAVRSVQRACVPSATSDECLLHQRAPSTRHLSARWLTHVRTLRMVVITCHIAVPRARKLPADASWVPARCTLPYACTSLAWICGRRACGRRCPQGHLHPDSLSSRALFLSCFHALPAHCGTRARPQKCVVIPLVTNRAPCNPAPRDAEVNVEHTATVHPVEVTIT